MSALKRYLVFASNEYYSGGGWRDFETSLDSLESAIAYGQTTIDPKYPHNRWWHVVDLTTGQMVADSYDWPLTRKP